MSLLRIGLLVLITAVTLAVPARPSDDETRVKGRTLTDWLKMLESDPRPEYRQAALIAIEILNPRTKPA